MGSLRLEELGFTCKDVVALEEGVACGILDGKVLRSSPRSVLGVVVESAQEARELQESVRG